MSASVRKFVPRAPRYTLRPSDNRYMRFAHKDDTGQVYTTKFVDISMTGLAFISNRESAPFIFDTVKIEIPLDQDKQIAWWAKVVRIEEYASHKWYLNREDFRDENSVLVAVKFLDLPLGHLQLIKKTLDKKFAEAEIEKKRERWKTLSALWAHYGWQFILYFICAAATFWILWYFSRPDINYDAEKGAPWGQRYKWTWPFGNDGP